MSNDLDKFWDIFDVLSERFPELSKEELIRKVESIISEQSSDEDDTSLDN